MKVLSSLAVMTASQYAIEVNQVEELLGGMIYGLIQKDDLKYIETCMSDSDKVVAEVNEAVTDIMKEDVTDIINGVKVLATLASELPDDFKDCEDMQKDANKLSAWVSSLVADPAALASLVATNVIKNFSGILDDINKTSADIAKNDYYTAGTDIADVVTQVIGTVPEDFQPEETEEYAYWIDYDYDSNWGWVSGVWY